MAESTSAGAPKPTLQISNAITDSDHGKIVVLAAWLCLTGGILISGVRIHVRWPLTTLAGKDDIACGIATVFAIIQTAMVLSAVNSGFGRTEEDLKRRESVHVAKMLYATDLVFLLSIWTGKFSVSLLFDRLARDSNKSRFGWVLSSLISTFTVVSVLIVALRQDLGQPWVYSDRNVASTSARWIAVGTMSVLVDLVMAGMSAYLVWDLQMNSRSKSLVMTAFGLRLLVAPVTIIRLISLTAVKADDLSFTYTLPEALTQLEMYCNLVAVTLPCLRLFLVTWNTSFMDLRLEGFDNRAYREHVTTYDGSNGRGSTSRNKQHSHLAWAPTQSRGRSKAFVETGNRDTDAASDNSERAIVVKRTIAVTNE